MAIGANEQSLHVAVIVVFIFVISIAYRFLSVHFLFILVVTFLLVACGGSGTLAPVQRLGAGGPRPSYYVVERGDTLYSIGWRYGLNYRQIAHWNEIYPPYLIYAGQKLRLIPPSREIIRYSGATATGKPGQRADSPQEGSRPAIKSATLSTSNAMAAQPGSSKENPSWASEVRTIQGISWCWPTQGKVTQAFSATEPGHKGVEIAGELGQPIVAAADGKVVYSGMGLARYGKLIIVKHSDHFLSAYAYNRILMSKEGEIVKGGQKIAEMGHSGTDRVKLHFEIRYDGRPMDPLRYLPKR